MVTPELMTTVQLERHSAEMRQAADELCLEAVCDWHGQFSYADIVLAVRRGLLELGYTQVEVWNHGTWHWVQVHVKQWVADGSVVVTRECHVGGNKPKLFQVVAR